MSFILSIKNAAKDVGLSLRQFRRIYSERDGRPIATINGKAFVLKKDLEQWKAARESR